jgi:hypothetical protein
MDMADVPDKDVTITVNNKTITVTVVFTPGLGYQPLVTVRQLPNGLATALAGTPITGGFQFVATVQPGDYDVEVVCSSKTFGDTVTVSGSATSPSATSSFSYKKR